MLVSKYADHLPLYRQSQIFAREDLDLERSTRADWVGKTTALLEPLPGRGYRSSCPVGRGNLRRRHACPDAGARHRQDPDRPALDLCP
uniref:IS66 family transposase n=1 Tax=Paenirhodobacter populi TaxID=2306993 RepID=UPI00240E3278|nr:transposase [Sinirhodobacter populi]